MDTYTNCPSLQEGLQRIFAPSFFLGLLSEISLRGNERGGILCCTVSFRDYRGTFEFDSGSKILDQDKDYDDDDDDSPWIFSQ